MRKSKIPVSMPVHFDSYNLFLINFTIHCLTYFPELIIKPIDILLKYKLCIFYLLYLVYQYYFLVCGGELFLEKEHGICQSLRS